eukprot:359990-Ditylum_brightwellii.AAC.1
MSLSTLRGNFKTANAERCKVHKRPAIPFISEEESTMELDKVEINLQVSPNATGQNTVKNTVAKFKFGNPEELIGWRIRLNDAIRNKPCKDASS